MFNKSIRFKKFRSKTNRKSSRRSFSKSAMHSNKKNRRKSVQRGGYRL